MLSAVSSLLRRSAQRRLVRRMNVLYYDGPNGVPLYHTTSWLGVRAFKCPLDLWIYQELIYRTRPECIIETGVRFGGSALYLASILDLIGSGSILAVDITLKDVAEATRAHPRIQLFECSSTDPAIVAELAQRTSGKRTMVILDSDHRKAHVLAELRAYSPLVADDCYLICEDTNVNGHPVDAAFGDGPYEAVGEFLRDTRDWEVDRRCERLLITFNPRGYLRRLRGGPWDPLESTCRHASLSIL